METNKKSKILIIATFVFVAITSRLFLPAALGFAPGNFAPIGAIALFSGAVFGRKWFSFLIPLVAVLVSDILVNSFFYNSSSPFYEGFYWQYMAYVLIAFGGTAMFGKIKVLPVLVGSLGASVLFFLISNFGCWIDNPIYPQTIDGLGLSYAAGLRYFDKTIISDLSYSAFLFGGYALVSRRAIAPAA